MIELKDKILLGIQEYQNNTMFMANWLRCNLQTRHTLSKLINEEGKIEGTDLFVIVRYDMCENECHVGMGEGPSFSIIKITDS